MATLSVEIVLSDLRRIVGDDKFTPSSPAQICQLLFTTVYMSSKNSSQHTRDLAGELAAQIGRYSPSTTSQVLPHRYYLTGTSSQVLPRR